MPKACNWAVVELRQGYICLEDSGLRKWSKSPRSDGAELSWRRRYV